MDLFQFGPYRSVPGTIEKDVVKVTDGQAFYAGSGKDKLTCGSTRIDDESILGGYASNSVFMSGGLGNDTYKFERRNDEWGFISDSGGGDDIIKFGKKNIFNPNRPAKDSRIDIFHIDDRDVLITSTNPDGIMSNGILVSDPFGNHPQFGEKNKIEKVKFGKKRMTFKKFYKKLKNLARQDGSDENYFFQEVTYSDLSNAGILDLNGFNDVSQLESGAYLGVTLLNNTLVDEAIN